MRRGVTLIEIIFTIAIAGILMVGTSEILRNVAINIQRAKQLTNLSLDTQAALDQLSSLIYDRVPNSAIGSNDFGTHWSLKRTNLQQGTILQWYGTLKEAKVSGAYSSFVDLEDSNFSSKTLKSQASNFNQVNTLMGQKLNGRNLTDAAIVFAGGLDLGVGTMNTTDETNFGWYGDSLEDVYPIASFASDTLTISNADEPIYIYEKYYIADTAYAIARGESININAQCIKDDIDINALSIKQQERKNLLLLFYDFRPWNKETFCADKTYNNTVSKNGKVALISVNIDGFEVDYMNSTIRLTLDAKEQLRGSDQIIHVNKQKAIF